MDFLNKLKGFFTKEGLQKSWIGLVCSGVLLIIEALFIYQLVASALLTPMLLTAAIVFLLVALAAVVWLTVDKRKKIRLAIGAGICVIVLVLQMVGGYYIGVGVAALEEITRPQGESVEVGLYVRSDDSAKKTEDTKSYTFGILKVMDRTVTDGVVEQLVKKNGKEITLKEYDTLGDLLDGLLSKKEVGAILLNRAFLELLQETEGHEKDLTKLREVETLIYQVPEISDEPIGPVDPGKPFTVYISGIDCFGDISRRSRSDVNVLMTVNPQTGQILLVTTPRDSYVPLSISHGIPDKLTHAGIYGIDVSKDTLAMLYDIDIDYYFRVNFDGFRQIIDALGGITVHSDYEFFMPTYDSTVKSYVDRYCKKGENNFNGMEALAFARERHKAGGDQQRGKHHLEVIRAVIEKMSSGTAVLKNYEKLMDSMTGTFETSMPYERVAALVQNQLQNNTKWNITTYAPTGTGASKKPYSLSFNAYVLQLNQSSVKTASKMIGQVLSGEVPTP